MAVPVKVLVTGAAGQIAYSLLYSIANGEVFGKEQPVALVLTDIPSRLAVLGGVAMELQDCALELLQGVTVTDCDEVAFRDLDVAVLVGAMPRGEGMASGDHLGANVRMFRSQGQALEAYAKKTVKVLVVGSPANTNCLVAMTSAPSIPRENFSCLTRLGQNQAQAKLGLTLGTGAGTVRNVIVWGNHSDTHYPDVDHASVTRGSRRVGLRQALGDARLLTGDSNMGIQHQGVILKGSGRLSSAMSITSAVCDHLQALCYGTQEGECVSMGVISNGNCYGIPEQLIYSFPVTVQNGRWQIVPGLSVSGATRHRMALSAQELLEEREGALRVLAKSNL
ncbi:malate dehydrogenase, cytoplasmic-like isoform X2 [Carcharodon carcharias]|uniref:malate dehydrogenase, cytoplasmic-like isoform X2 n=1 Tax=Carcharodon carcharias TaxID=13397 RepID=UPI001B7EF7C5|nr:malate dehydrogenase, cytoplasmic-like isoform X2 [Carcharodon carcharias]